MCRGQTKTYLQQLLSKLVCTATTLGRRPTATARVRRSVRPTTGGVLRQHFLRARVRAVLADGLMGERGQAYRIERFVPSTIVDIVYDV